MDKKILERRLRDIDQGSAKVDNSDSGGEKDEKVPKSAVNYCVVIDDVG